MVVGGRSKAASCSQVWLSPVDVPARYDTARHGNGKARLGLVRFAPSRPESAPKPGGSAGIGPTVV
jgi:hypothetical protein